MHPVANAGVADAQVVAPTAVHVTEQSVPPNPVLHKVATFEAEQVKILPAVQVEHELPSAPIKKVSLHLVTVVAVHLSAPFGQPAHVLSDVFT